MGFLLKFGIMKRFALIGKNLLKTDPSLKY